MVISKKKLIAAVLAALCVTSGLFMVIPIRSPTTDGEYDPWIDTNDDGIINYKDLGNLATRFGTLGTPINKTDLLLELQARVDSLNASVIGLEEDVSMLDSMIDTLNMIVLDLVPRVDALEAPESVTTERIADDAVTTDKIDDYAVTNDKLAAFAVPFKVMSWTGIDSTSSTTFEDMPEMSLDITLSRESTLLIMFSTKAWVLTGSYYIYLRAMVDATQAQPVSSSIALRAETTTNLYSYTFYSPNVAPETYTIKIQWKVSGGTAAVRERTLIVIALPA